MQSAMNALNPVMTVGEQMRDACKAHSAMSQRGDRRALGRGAAPRLDRPGPPVSYPHQLSGGMRQRAMIAMALLFTPELVIMDEPTSALDVVAQRSLMRQIKELQHRLGFAVIFVTHDISLVRHFSDRLLVMYAGQVAELGATSEVFGTPRHPYARALLEAYPLDPRREGRPHRHRGLAAKPGCRRRRGAGSSPAARTRCPSARSQQPPLYDRAAPIVRCLLYKDARRPRPEALPAVLRRAANR